MNDKFSIEELMIRILPGGFLLTFVFFQFGYNTQITLDQNLDFLYTFLFLCSSFIVGELLQTIAHELEWVIDIFFKFRRPSQVFLYKNNPVLNSKYKRDELLEFLDLPEQILTPFQKDYSEIPLIFKRKKEVDDLSQSIFWKLYHEVSEREEIRICNRNYLFTRVISITFLIIGIALFTKSDMYTAMISLLIFFILLWRSRGVARGLVFKTILLNLKNKV
ncbi:MAG: hypothetical protein O3B64_04005 [bacterium]|nr:hypothetical protein [bacterium]